MVNLKACRKEMLIESIEELADVAKWFLKVAGCDDYGTNIYCENCVGLSMKNCNSNGDREEYLKAVKALKRIGEYNEL